MALTGKLGQMKYYLFRLLKGIIKKKMKLKRSHEPITREMKRSYNEYLIQEKLLIKILNECFDLKVDTALIEMSIRKGGG